MKSAIFTVAVLAATTEANLTHGKAAYLQAHGSSLSGLQQRHEKIKTQHALKKVAVQKNAKALRLAHEQRKIAQSFDEYGNEIIDDFIEDTTDATGLDLDGDDEENTKPDAYYENMLYGIIDGLTADFDENCAASMYGVVNGGFRAKEYKNVIMPSNTIKFQMSMNTLTESTNSVYAYCDFSHFYGSISQLTDYNEPEQYIQIGSRVLGSMIQQVPKLRSCMKQGSEAQNGYDVGICGGGIVSVFLDTLL